MFCESSTLKNTWYKTQFFPIDKRDSHTLFEPKKATNLKVGHWSRYCAGTKNTNFCKIWIGIKWSGTKFLYESNNKEITWANFKYSENDELQNGILDNGDHQCKYKPNICNQKTNCFRWLRSKFIKVATYFEMPEPITKSTI